MGAIENVAKPTECDVVVVLGLGSVGLAALMVQYLSFLSSLLYLYPLHPMTYEPPITAY
jgi:hypothetical protein